LFCTLQLRAQSAKTKIIPTPTEVIYSKGNFLLNELGVLEYDKRDEELMNLASLVQEEFTISSKGSAKLVLTVQKDSGTSGSYQLDIKPQEITITGADGKGVFYGVQSLLQLADQSTDNTIDCQQIKDEPGFEWRGLHIDVARTYYPEAQIKKILRMMAYYKLNTLHWHLSDDQAWRLEIKKYPHLAEIGSYGGPYSVIGSKWLGEGYGQGNGMYYKHKHVKRILEYAKEMYIDVVPEIDVPAHAAAFLAAFPELRCTSIDSLPDPHIGLFGLEYNWRNKEGLKQYQWDANREVCIGKEETFEVLTNVFDEVMDLFPSEYIHIGGDEAYKHGWEKCEHCRKRMEEEGLDDVKKLQSYFVKRLEKHIISKNRKMIGWNEIMQGGINASTSVMFWNGHNHDKEVIETALENGNNMIMTPINNVYFDITYERRSEKDVYQYQPLEFVPAQFEDKIMGIQACVWGEHGRLDGGGQVRFDAMENFERMMFPRLLPLAELAWHKQKVLEDEEFYQLIEKHVKVLKEKKGIAIGEVKMVPWW
jgi:hexosaminidase